MAIQETSPSVVYIKDLELAKNPQNRSEEPPMLIEDDNVKVKGTGSGFVWDKFGHIVSPSSLILANSYFLPNFRLLKHFCFVTGY